MTSKKDYYEILGVSRTASDKEIKAAYRRLARKHHPDVNPGDRSAEERFKEIAEAFAVLSDKDKRATYDRGGHDAFGPGFDPFGGQGFDLSQFGFGNIEDLFELFGGGGARRGRRPTRPSRGQDLHLEMQIPFVDAVSGTTLDVAVPRRAVCPACGGEGTRPAGKGKSSSCPECDGTGRVRTTERMKVRIPAGIDDGGRVRLAGKGDAGQKGGPPGDAYLEIRVEPHPLFRREGSDLVVEVPVGVVRAILGGTVDVPTLDGRATISLPGGTRSGQKFRLKGRGVAGAGSRPAGDLFAVIQIVTPKAVDGRSRELLEEFERRNPGA